MFYESVTDPDTRQQLTDSRGFCAEHVKDVIQNGNLLGASIIYADVVEATITDLKKKKQLHPSKPCPACTLAKQDEGYHLKLLVTHLEEQELREIYLRSQGLCSTHLKQACKIASSGVRQFILTAEIDKLEHLREQLTKAASKMDYRNTEVMGDERDAWIRAIQKIGGSLS
jgi:hypothetical protein